MNARFRLKESSKDSCKYSLNKNCIVKDVTYNSEIKVAIIREEGSNSDREMAAAFYHAGAKVTDVTSIELIEGKVNLDNYHGIVFVGGFSFADVLGSGIGWAWVLSFLNSPSW